MKAPGLFLLLAAGLALPGCDAEITAPKTEAYFTLWGTLDPTTTRQALRVVPILPQIDAETSAPLDATVTTTDLTTGEVFRWRDSTVTFPSGRVGHVFQANQSIGFGHGQLVTVTRSDGATTTAYVRMPLDVPPVLETPTSFPAIVSYPVLWPGAPRVEVVSVHYELRDRITCAYFNYDVPRNDGSVTVDATGYGWRTSWSLDRARRFSFANLPRSIFANLPTSVHVLKVTLAVEVTTLDARPPGGVYDPFLYFDPSLFTNVAHGFGLVTGAYVRTAGWSFGDFDCIPSS